MVGFWGKAAKNGPSHREQENRPIDPKELRQRVVQEIREALWKVAKNKEQHLQFICEEDVKKIWTSRRIEQLSWALEWGKRDMHNRAKSDFLKVLSTLVWIYWDRWEDFGNLFLKRHDRSDKNLPLSNTSFFQNERLQSTFEQSQYIFIPVKLKEDGDGNHNDIDNYITYSKNHRMPFYNSEEIGEGGSGKVTKEAIPPGHFFWKEGHVHWNSEEQYFAVKRIERRESNPTGFMTEHRNLKSFKQCLGQNKNIMLSLTTFAHGSNFVIISRLADLDLNIFFEGSYNDFEKRKRLFTPISLLRESLGLAAALDFLHDGLRVSGGAKVACAHLDLKPANILVEWSSRPVGRWKIHDFGTSRIKEPPPTNPRDSGLKAPGDFLRQFSFTIAGRAPGPFQAPEVQLSQERVVGRESDMWSFGCILAFVLAFTTGGPKHITELVNALNEPIPDTTATTDFFYTPESIDKSNFIVKPKVVQWLTGLDIGNTVWVSNTLDLIFKTLAVDAKARPKASEVLDDLAIACRDGTNNFNAVCSWVSADEDLGAEIPHPISPLTKSPSIHSNREPSQTTDGPDSRPASVAIPSTPLSNSTSGSGLSETSPTRSHETSEPVLFMKLDAPRDTFRTTICPSSCHVAFLSKRLVTIHCLKNETNWAGKRPRSISHPMIHSPDVGRITCLDGYDWNYICLSDSYILLRAGDQRGREKRIHLYRYDACDDTSSRKLEEVPFVERDDLSVHAAATEAVEMAVSSRGDVLFMLDARLYFYSSQLGGLKELKITGQLKTGGASFSPDGSRIYGWSFLKNETVWENYWYLWNAEDAKQVSRFTTPLETPESNKGRDTLFPFSTYFSAFERPNRIYVIGKEETRFRAIKLSRPVNDIVAGCKYYRSLEPGDESLVLVTSNGSLINLNLLSNVDASSPSSVGKLKDRLTQGKDGIAVLELESSVFVVVSHCNGCLERRIICHRDLR